MRLTFLVSCLTLTAVSFSASAETRNGISASAYVWNTSADGRSSREQRNLTITADTEESEPSASDFFAISAEFKPRWAPKMRMRFSDLHAESNDSATANTFIGGMPITLRDNLKSTYAFDFYELSAAWRLKRNVFYLDYGLSLQYLKGDISTSGTMISSREEFKTPLPALHLATGVSLRRQMILNAEVQGAAYGGNSLIESEFTFSILPNKKSGVVLGYRIFDIDFSNDSLDVNVDFRGGFLGARLGL